jgi:hypothetical protein
MATTRTVGTALPSSAGCAASAVLRAFSVGRAGALDSVGTTTPGAAARVLLVALTRSGLDAAVLLDAVVDVRLAVATVELAGDAVLACAAVDVGPADGRTGAGTTVSWQMLA